MQNENFIAMYHTKSNKQWWILFDLIRTKDKEKGTNGKPAPQL